MIQSIKCFLLEPTNRHTRFLRRMAPWVTGAEHHCRCLVPLDTVTDHAGAVNPSCPDDDIGKYAWPTACDTRGQPMPGDASYEFFLQKVWRRADTGEEMSTEGAPAGAIYRAPWLEDSVRHRGPDGKSYICIIPSKPDWSGRHSWMMDGAASNCDMPDDPVHKCWCRHGEAPVFTVDKVGNTCRAGAGSILSPGGWHGFLRDGVLVYC
jgi:hypothetical protein